MAHSMCNDPIGNPPVYLHGAATPDPAALLIAPAQCVTGTHKEQSNKAKSPVGRSEEREGRDARRQKDRVICTRRVGGEEGTRDGR